MIIYFKVIFKLKDKILKVRKDNVNFNKTFLNLIVKAGEGACFKLNEKFS